MDATLADPSSPITEISVSTPKSPNSPDSTLASLHDATLTTIALLRSVKDKYEICQRTGTRNWSPISLDETLKIFEDHLASVGTDPTKCAPALSALRDDLQGLDIMCQNALGACSGRITLDTDEKIKFIAPVEHEAGEGHECSGQCEAKLESDECQSWFALRDILEHIDDVRTVIRALEAGVAQSGENTKGVPNDHKRRASFPPREAPISWKRLAPGTPSVNVHE